MPGSAPPGWLACGEYSRVVDFAPAPPPVVIDPAVARTLRQAMARLLLRGSRDDYGWSRGMRYRGRRRRR
jgi:hypothetical protein